MSHPSASDPAAAGWHSLLSAAAAVGQPAAPGSAAASSTSAASASAHFQRLYRDGLQSILSFLCAAELLSARRMCAAWLSAAHAERKRRLIAMQTEAVALINTDAAAGAAWKELCVASESASAPSLQSDLLSMLMRCASGQLPTGSSTLPASEHQLIAAHKLISALVSSSVTLCDELLDRGILPPLLGACTAQSSRLPLLQSATACLHSLTRLSSQSRFSDLCVMLPVLAQLIYTLDDTVLIQSLAAIAALSDDVTSDHSQIQELIQTGLTRRVVELTMHKSVDVKSAALTVIANICRGDDLHRQLVLNCNALPCLLALLMHAKQSIRRGACAALAHICTGNQDQLQSVVDSAVIPALISIMRNSELELKKDAAAVIAHLLVGGTNAQVHYVVEQGVIAPLCELLACNDAAAILLALDGLASILRVGAKRASSSQFAEMVEECNGTDYLEALQEHESEDIYKKAASILATYFVHEEGDEAEGGPAAAETADGAPAGFSQNPSR